MEQILENLYKQHLGEECTSTVKLQGSGSNRHYYRLTGPAGSVIGVVGPSVDENKTFIYLANHFKEKGLPVPEVYLANEEYTHYIQEDLGDMALFDAVKEGREKGGEYSQEHIELLKRTIEKLPSMQILGGEGLDWDKCYPLPAMDRASIQFDLNYFKYDFLKFTGVEFHEFKLEMDFHALADDLLAGAEDTFLYRDFQARNVMLRDGVDPMFIDFQGGRRGPIYYDVASFLWQASAHYSSALREYLIQVYLREFRKFKEVDEREFYKNLNLWVLFRLLQVLGAYGFRGLFERKKHFIESIAPALQNLEVILNTNDFRYSYLIQVLRSVIALESFDLPDGTRVQLREPKPLTKSKPYASKFDNKGPLKVRVFSFSFWKGIPADESGNGGGYVFDVRCTHNPGRYAEYKHQTGLDKPVKDFLEKDGEIIVYLRSVYKLADAHVERYIKRGFTNLMFCFGCTGGQHRSVYAAQHLAEHISKKYGVEVELLHREQGISQHFEAHPVEKNEEILQFEKRQIPQGLRQLDSYRELLPE